VSRLLILIPLCLMLLTGCPVAKGPVFFEAPPDSQKGTFYFYRVEESFDFTPTIKLDDKPFVELQRLGYSFTYLSPGVHKLTVTFPGGPPLTTELEIAPGKIMAIRLSGNSMHCVLAYMPWEKARDELREARFIKPFEGF